VLRAIRPLLHGRVVSIQVDNILLNQKNQKSIKETLKKKFDVSLRTFMLECPLYNFIKKESSISILLLSNLKSFYQLDHRTDIGYYLTKTIALHHFLGNSLMFF
jgi:hypothetical protein